MSTPYFKAFDIAIIYIASYIAYYFRFKEIGLPQEYFLSTTLFAILSSFALDISKFYGLKNTANTKEKLARLILGFLITAILTSSILYLTKTGEAFSRLWFTWTLSLSILLIITIRELLTFFLKNSVGSREIILVGKNGTAYQALSMLQSPAAQKDGLVLSYHHEREIDDQNATLNLKKITKILSNSESNAKEIWISSDVFTRISTSKLELILSETSATIVYLPEMPKSILYSESMVESVLGVPTINSGLSNSIKINTFIKYLEDKVGAAIALLFLSPFLLIICALIKIDSKGAVFFKQKRHGFGGREFLIYKFRTMKASNDKPQFSQAEINDDRVTKVGRMLRKLSLDELPQLINVLNGSMSLVGPRPHPMELNNDYRHLIDGYMHRHSVKPGITGLAQINGFRGGTPEQWMMEGRIKHDLEYVKRWSPWLDLKILFMTIVHLINPRNAY